MSLSSVTASSISGLQTVAVGRLGQYWDQQEGEQTQHSGPLLGAVPLHLREVGAAAAALMQNKAMRSAPRRRDAGQSTPAKFGMRRKLLLSPQHGKS